MNLVKIMRMPTGGAATPLYCAAAACGRTLLALACSIAASTATEAGRTATAAGAFVLRPMAKFISPSCVQEQKH